jgi:hypothetical protein
VLHEGITARFAKLEAGESETKRPGEPGPPKSSLQLAIEDVHRDFKAKTQIGCLGFAPLHDCSPLTELIETFRWLIPQSTESAVPRWLFCVRAEFCPRAKFGTASQDFHY